MADRTTIPSSIRDGKLPASLQDDGISLSAYKRLKRKEKKDASRRFQEAWAATPEDIGWIDGSNTARVASCESTYVNGSSSTSDGSVVASTYVASNELPNESTRDSSFHDHGDLWGADWVFTIQDRLSEDVFERIQETVLSDCTHQMVDLYGIQIEHAFKLALAAQGDLNKAGNLYLDGEMPWPPELPLRRLRNQVCWSTGIYCLYC
eukprot:jgi/Botrbrau1/1367/Bobra.0063s0076.2